jgi:Bacterial protein of unknown function (DUF885)
MVPGLDGRGRRCRAATLEASALERSRIVKRELGVVSVVLLFWRMHRCARIIFSLQFHMGAWSPQECVDFLVDRVGFGRENAIGEVRRSFQGGYGPLYQAAYLLGGLQLRALRKEIVDIRQMGQKPFRDEILRQGSMAITTLPTQAATRAMRQVCRHLSADVAICDTELSGLSRGTRDRLPAVCTRRMMGRG